MKNPENYKKQVKRRRRKCGEAVETIHEIVTQEKRLVGMEEFIDEMYLNLMRSESYLAQDNAKRCESTSLYQTLKEGIQDIKAVPWK